MKKAAEQGAIPAFKVLANYYSHGQGDIEPDQDEAKRWIERAAAKGDKEAIAELEDWRREKEEEEDEWSTVDEDEDGDEEKDDAFFGGETPARAFAQARAQAEAAREETERFLALNGALRAADRSHRADVDWSYDG
ncbi:hypothetical protein JL721_587 [Aureococcus anophagefferens]|nr:hypothetical protein JL721_587 [Aureococcus anophagefferens]